MESLLLPAVLVVIMVLALALLAKSWVHSSSIGGYRTDHAPDGIETGPAVGEDDDVRWDWGSREKPES